MKTIKARAVKYTDHQGHTYLACDTAWARKHARAWAKKARDVNRCYDVSVVPVEIREVPKMVKR